LRCAEAVTRVFGQHLVDDRNQLGRQVVALFTDRRRSFQGQGADHFDGCVVSFARKWRLAAEQLVQGRTERINVRADVDVVAVTALLGGHVVQRAHHLPRAGQVAARTTLIVEQRQAEVEDLNQRRLAAFATAGQHQVRWFDVAMDHAVFMCFLQADCRLANHFARVGNGHGTL
jgi:hypothetical protein